MLQVVILFAAAALCSCGPSPFDPLPVAASPVGDEPHYLSDQEIEDIPNAFPTTWIPPDSPELRAIYENLSSTGKPNSVGKLVSILIALDPLVVPVTMRECGSSGAHYDPNDQTITICYEFLVMANRLLGKDDVATVDSETSAVLMFVLLHEIGHALVDALDLVVEDKEEDVVDRFAILMITVADDDELVEKFVRTPAAFFSHHGEEVKAAGGPSSRDVHSPSGERAWDSLCLLYGRKRNPEIASALGANAHQCLEYTAAAEQQWNAVLRSYTRMDSGKVF